MQKIPLFYVSKNSTKIKHIKRVKDGDLISFVSQGEIVCLEESSNFSDFLLNDDFYQNNYLNFIKKNAERWMKKEDLQKKILIKVCHTRLPFLNIL